MLTLRPLRPIDRAFFRSARRAAFRRYIDAMTPSEAAADAEKAERLVVELPFQLIEEDGAPVGYLCVIPEEDHDLLKEIALDPGAQGRGIGARVVRGVQEGAAARGVGVRLSVREDNPARRLYERLGFRITRVEPPRIKMEWLPGLD